MFDKRERSVENAIKEAEPVIKKKWHFDLKSGIIGGLSSLAIVKGAKAGIKVYEDATAEAKADKLEKQANEFLEKAEELRSRRDIILDDEEE